MNNQLLLVRLEEVLGKSVKTARTNHAFHCPFCNHSKKKLEVDLQTDEKGRNRWACWVCSAKGQTIRSLLNKLRTPSDKKQSILSLIKGSTFTDNDYVYQEQLTLPESFIPLHQASTESIIVRRFRNYLNSRGITDTDIISYNIGYCTKGDYKDRIVIPSYDENNELNFYIGRSINPGHYPKYKNPPGDKELIFFESRINWDLPITLVEGVFDALAVKRNAIPILGTNPPKTLLKTIIEKGVQTVYIALDKEALDKALSLSMKILPLVSEVYIVELDQDDPSSAGFTNFQESKYRAQYLDDSSLLKLKLR